MLRDFTYVGDVAAGVVAVLDHPPIFDPDWDAERADPATSRAPYRIYNVGNHEPVPLLRFIEVLERAMGRDAVKRLLPMQPGDVLSTYADVERLAREVGFRPGTSIEEGVRRFVEWFKAYDGVPVESI